ncbi:hypothetical protein CRG98_017835 [Punica granatum]|uniref:Uncharacterized protein n=1 Tax=Punica granatum TaxID=22663 RepID=A0A2I0JZR0_PUNGR|nr:hypothetical protein CRG98_017835 [Punica granatum]
MQPKIMRSTPPGPGDCSGTSPMSTYSLVWIRRGVMPERECLLKTKVLVGRKVRCLFKGLQDQRVRLEKEWFGLLVVGSELCLGRCPESAELSKVDVAAKAIARWFAGGQACCWVSCVTCWCCLVGGWGLMSSDWFAGDAPAARRGTRALRWSAYVPRRIENQSLDARPPGLLLAMHGHMETLSIVPQQLYRLFDRPVDLGPFSSRCRCPGVCSGRRPFLMRMTGSVLVSFAGVTNYGNLREKFNQGCPSVRRLPSSCCRELQSGMSHCTSLRNAHRGRMMSEKCKVDPWEVPSSTSRPIRCRAWWTLNSGSVIITTLEWSDRDWGPHSCTFPDCGLACAVVLKKARGAGSQKDRAMLRSSELSPVIVRGVRAGPQCLEFKELSRRRASASKVCIWVRWRHARTTRKDALSCARLREEMCARSRDDPWLRGVSEKLALPRKVDRPSSHGSPCHGGRVKVAVGLPAKEVPTHLYDGMLVVMRNSK